MLYLFSCKVLNYIYQPVSYFGCLPFQYSSVVYSSLLLEINTENYTA